ncbi:MAG: hypothetical protein IAE89_06995 [Anaerolineae bacterium]|nr:hypothetical protein [Anaerolineae bacterium]
MALSQMAAVVRYELLMAWRRRALLVMGGFFLLALIGFTAMQPPAPVELAGTVQVDTSTDPPTIIQEYSAVDGLTVEELNISLNLLPNTQLVVTMIAVIFPVLVAITVVVFFAESIPLDRQYRVRELFDSTPLANATYLGGKLLGAWAALGLTLLVVMISFGILARLIVGAFDPLTYLQAWFLAVFPFALTCTGWSVLAASGAGSRRKAIMIGLVLVPGAMILYALFSIQFWAVVLDVGSRMSADEPLTLTALFGEAISQSAVMQLWFLASVAALFLIVWAWSRVRG